MATSIDIRLHAVELSRLEDDRKTLVATVYPKPSTATAVEGFRVDLVKARRRRDAVVASLDLTFPAGDVSRGLPASFDLGRVVDSDGLPATRRGRYFLRVTSLGTLGVVAESQDVDVRLLTSQRLRADYLHGLDRLPADVLVPRGQPRLVTGVEIVDVDPITQPGFHVLACQVDASGARTLSWAGGPMVAIDPRFQRFVLADDRDGWIEVDIANPGDLPGASVQESILIDRNRVDAGQLGRLIDRASDWLEQTLLQVFLEPTILSTNGESLPQVPLSDAPPAASSPVDYDVQVPPLTLYPRNDGSWTAIRFPYAQVSRIFSLAGQIAGASVLAIPPEWVQVQERNGFAQVVPFQPHGVLGGFAPVAGGLFQGAEVPNFWHFVVRAGLRRVPEDIIEAIGKKAAIDALTLLGQAFKPGIGSESFGKDLSVSTSYIRNAQANLLSATRAEYREDLSELLPRLRAKYLGLPVTFV